MPALLPNYKESLGCTSLRRGSEANKDHKGGGHNNSSRRGTTSPGLVANTRPKCDWTCARKSECLSNQKPGGLITENHTSVLKDSSDGPPNTRVKNTNSCLC